MATGDGRARSPLGLPRVAALYFRLASAPPADPVLRELLDGFAEWEALRVLARRDGTTGAVWRRLKAAGAAPAPADADAFRREADVLDFHRLLLERRLGEVLALLAQVGLSPPVLLKGAGLAHTAYRRPAERPMRDLDLLLPRPEAEQASSLLQAAGWRPAAGSSDGLYDGHQHLRPLVSPGGAGGVVELHHALFPGAHPSALDAAAVRGRARPMRVAGAEALVPSAEDQLLHACLHFAWSHELRWGFWQLAADVAALARGNGAAHSSGGLRWRVVVERAAAARCGAGAYWALRLAGVVAGAPTDAETLAGLRPPATGDGLLLRHLAHQLAPGPGNVPSVTLARRLWARALRPPPAVGAAAPWATGAGGERLAAVPIGHRFAAHLARASAWGRYWRAVVG